MNEENNVKEPIYLTYGSDLIDLLAFLNNAANDLENYLSNQPWSAKRKDLFRKAYVDIMNGGVTGATNTSGQWQITHNGDIDLSSKSQKEREMYGEAAYYIQQQMSKIPTKQNEEKLAEEEKKELPLFDNEFFTSGLQDYIGNNMFGGRNWSTTDDWNILDKRGENGLRGTSVRSKKLAEMLLNYSNTLEEGKYNFEGSPFKNLTDFKSRINNAISALNNDDPNDDRDALNAIGLRANDFLYDGSGDIADTEGHTYSQLALAIQAQNEADAKAKEDQELALTEANRKANSGVLDFIGGIHGTDARTNPQAYAEYISKNLGVGLQGFNEMNKAVQGLIEKGYNNGKGGGLTNAEKRQLGNFLYYIRQNNPNVKSGGWKISNLEWTELSKHKNLGSTNRDKYVRLPWQTSDGRYTYADDLGNVYFLKPLNLAKLTAPTFLRSAAYNNYKNNFLKSENNLALNTTIGSNNGLTDDMIADLTAMGLDTVSAGAAFAPGYGTLASAITGIGATISGAVADRMRGESWGSTLGTAGLGLSMDILGLIPGVGIGAKATKIAKVVAKGAKWLGPALGGLAAMSYGPGAISAYNKFTSGKKDDVTAEELRDFTYAIRAIAAGGIRKAGATYLGNRTLATAIKGEKTVGTTAKGPRASISSEKTSASITTKNGLKINLTDDEFKTLKGNGSRESKIELLKNKGIKEEDIEWKGINPAKGRFKTSSKSSKLSGLQEGTESNKIKWSSTSADYKGIRRFSNENLLRGFTTMSAPNSGIWNRIRNRWTGQDILNRPLTLSSNKPVEEPQKLLPLIKREYNPPKTESLEIIPISRALPLPGGTHKGNIIDNSRPGVINSNRITLGDANLEFNDFHRMYIASTRKNSKVPSKAFGNGYGTSKEPESGSLDFNGMTATLTKLNDNRGFSITFGKSGDTVIAKQYKDIQQLRSEFAKLLNKIIKKQSNVKETAALLRQFKAKGWLKQGGTIDKQRIQRYKEFIKK